MATFFLRLVFDEAERLGPGKVALHEAIAAEGSISGAARSRARRSMCGTAAAKADGIGRATRSRYARENITLRQSVASRRRRIAISATPSITTFALHIASTGDSTSRAASDSPAMMIT